MVITRIWGGLGNQMFQYAMGYAMAKEKLSELCLDVSFYNLINTSAHSVPRQMGLFEFPIENKKVINNISSYSHIISVFQKPVINYMLRKFSKCNINIGKITYVKETRLEYLPYVEDIKQEQIYLDGYWHCEKYFIKYREEILKQFIFSNDSIDDEYKRIKSSNDELVAVHIRRGDYATDNNPNMRGEEYYRDAIKKIRELIPNARVCFFSDDIQYVESHFGDLNNACIANKTRKLNDVEELQLMIKCQHQIISNSSYSWWGAWLNQNNNKIIVAPSVWKNKKDMMLDTWICI